MASVLNLAKLPLDILLHVTAFQSLADNVTFCQICRAFNTLSSNRSMWIQALKRERLFRPIACTTCEDLANLDLNSLRCIVFHTLRLGHNWRRQEPRVIGPIKALTLGLEVRSLDLIFQVPATELYVFHSRLTGDLVTWDAGAGRQVGAPVYVAKRVMDVSPGQEDKGRFWMGLLTAEDPNTYRGNKIIVVNLEYGSSIVPKLSVIFKHTLEPQLSHWAIFMTKDCVGVLECPPAAHVVGEVHYVSVISFNLSDNRKAVISTDMRGQDFAHAHSGSSTINDDVFILIEDERQSHVTHIPKNALPHNDNPNCPSKSNIKWADIPPAIVRDLNPTIAYIPEGALSANDSYKAPAVSLHAAISNPPDPSGRPHITRKMHIRFWGPSNSSSAVTAASLVLRGHIEVLGQLQDSPYASWKLMLLSHTGRSMLLVMDLGTHLELRLINYDPETSACSSHLLEVPAFIELSYVYGLSMDDHRGVITLLDTRGYLYAIPYA